MDAKTKKAVGGRRGSRFVEIDGERVEIFPYEVKYIKFVAREHRRENFPPIVMLKRCALIKADAKAVITAWFGWLNGKPLPPLDKPELEAVRLWSAGMELLISEWKKVGGKVDLKGLEGYRDSYRQSIISPLAIRKMIGG